MFQWSILIDKEMTMSNKPKQQTIKRKKKRKGKKALSIIVAGLLFIILACRGDCKCKQYNPETDSYECVQCPHPEHEDTDGIWYFD
jgi:hypothetical protein